MLGCASVGNGVRVGSSVGNSVAVSDVGAELSGVSCETGPAPPTLVGGKSLPADRKQPANASDSANASANQRA
jgi:hypothetical protein